LLESGRILEVGPGPGLIAIEIAMLLLLLLLLQSSDALLNRFLFLLQALQVLLEIGDLIFSGPEGRPKVGVTAAAATATAIAAATAAPTVVMALMPSTLMRLTSASATHIVTSFEIRICLSANKYELKESPYPMVRPSLSGEGLTQCFQKTGVVVLQSIRIKGVVYVRAMPLASYQAGLPQYPQMLRNGGLCHSQTVGQGIHAQGPLVIAQ
jgi:hypothetical protein